MTEFEMLSEMVKRFGSTIDYEIEPNSIWLIGAGSDEPTKFLFDDDGKAIGIR
jgi:hypothetical protein